MPAPRKREEELQRPRERRGGDVQPVTRGTMRPVAIPRIPTDWHEHARRFFNSLKTSGQADFMQDSDWAFAVFICQEIHEYRAGPPQGRTAMRLDVILKGMARLMPTEMDRRQARIELSEPKVEETSTAELAISSYEDQLAASSA